MSEWFITKENVMDFYNMLSDHTAKCRFCNQTYNFNFTNFRQHLRARHNEVLENKIIRNQTETPEIYFDPENLNCFICDAKNVGRLNFRCHLCSMHSVEKIKEYEYTKNIKQYCKVNVSESCSVKCEICSKDISLCFDRSGWSRHIITYHEDKVPNIQEPSNIAAAERDLSLETNVMSMPSNISNESELRQNCKKLESFQTDCQFCTIEFTYVDIENFRQHLFQRHQKDIAILLIERNYTKTPKVYFFGFRCLICSQNYMPQNFVNHVISHYPTEITNYEIQKCTWTYCTKNNGIKVLCKICGDRVSLFISERLIDHVLGHSENTQVTYHTADLSEHGVSISQMPSNIRNERELWENYTKLSNFQAKCKFCEFQDLYVNIRKFSQHLENNHCGVPNEKIFRGKWPNMYFRYYAVFQAMCLICNKPMFNSSNLKEQHLYKEHNLEESDCYHCNYYGWECKYCDKSGDLDVKCNLCDMNIRLDLELSRLNHHIANTHLNNPQEMIDIPGPSTRQEN